MMTEIEKYIHWNEGKAQSVQNYTLIMPDISIGNVGQLAVDLLLSNLKVEHVGCIVHPCFVPFIGGDPFDPESKRLESSCEIYLCKEKNLVILQIRSQVFKSKYFEFKYLLLNFIKCFSFNQTIVVASSSSEYFPAEQLQGIPLHYLSTTKFCYTEALKLLNWEKFSLPNRVVNEDHIPGSFVSQDLLEECEVHGIPLLVLICICSEGDNYPEALHVVKCINSWLNLKQVKNSEETWKMPSSWELPYGSAPPPELY